MTDGTLGAPADAPQQSGRLDESPSWAPFFAVVVPVFPVVFATSSRWLPYHIDPFSNAVPAWNTATNGSVYLDDFTDYAGVEYWSIGGTISSACPWVTSPGCGGDPQTARRSDVEPALPSAGPCCASTTSRFAKSRFTMAQLVLSTAPTTGSSPPTSQQEPEPPTVDAGAMPKQFRLLSYSRRPPPSRQEH